MLYGMAREYIGDTKDKIIFDLYSGTGTIAQILAPVAKRVVGVEIVEEAVAAARANAELNSPETNQLPPLVPPHTLSPAASPNPSPGW